MRKSLLLLPLIASMPLTAMADWNDVTEQMIQNPNFDNNSGEGWDYWCWGGACNLNYDAIEAFNGWFDVSQKVWAPAGNYRLSCQAYYRMGDNDNAYAAHTSGKEDIMAVLYANDFEKPVPSIYDYHSTGEFTWWGNNWFEKSGKQYPNSMEAGSMMFGYGHYNVTLEFKHDGGDLELGVKNKSDDFSHYNSDWCMMDNFRLEYDGVVGDIPVELFGCYDDALTLMSGEEYVLYTYVFPTNATDRNNILWSSSDTSVATVDANGMVTGIAQGSAVITGKCGGQEVQVQVTVMQYDETGKSWIDVTDMYLQNVNMEDGFDAWSRVPARVDYDMAEFWNCMFDFNQGVELPEGFYRFSCEGFFRPTSSAQEAVDAKGNTSNVAYIYGGTRQVPMLDITSERIEEYNSLLTQVHDDEGWFYLPNTMEAAKWCFEHGYYNYSSVVFYTSGEEKVELGLRCYDYVGGQWAIFDNFRLEYLTELVATEKIDIAAGLTELVPGETLQLSATVTPDNATYQSVLWSSSDESVLTVDDNGFVTAIGTGTATIIATARDNDKVTGTVTIKVVESVGAGNELVINEVMSMNVDQFLDPSFNYGGWIELYNPTSSAVSLKDCFITENPDNLTEHRLVDAGVVPAHGYYTIWFDHFDKYFPTQVDFKLSTSGDWVAVVSPQGEVMVEIEYPAGVQRCSWARKVDGGDEWGYTSQPTPGKSNAISKNWGTKQLAAPTVDLQGQFFEGGIVVKASWPEGSTLYYTTDGSTPTATNGFVSDDGVFEFTRSRNLRLCAVQDGWLPSPVVTNTYIKRTYDFTLPILSITANSEDLTGADHGIFVRGNGHGRSGNGQSSKCNWNQDWDRPCTFEYYSPEGVRTFMQDVDICAAGGWSRAWEPHSFKLKAAKVYGLNSMDYPFFDSKPYNKHKALQIRNGGNDNNCRFKDAAIQTIIQRSGIYVDGQAYQPVAYYINGQFKGVINMREPNNKHHAYSNYGYDTDFMDQFEMSPDSGWVQKLGDRVAYDRLLELSEEAADPRVYETICNELLDIDEYINYMACWLWLGNSDWMRNNVKSYRSTETDGKFHYVMFDTDGSFSYSGRSSFSRLDGWNRTEVGCDYMYDVGYSMRVPFENVDMWFNLLQNDSFRKKFVDTYSLVCGSVFEAQRCSDILDELYNRVQPMMELTGGSSWGTYNDLKRTMTASRNNTNISGIAQYWAFVDETGDAKNVTFSSNIPEATITYNGMDVPTGKFTGRAYLPVTLTACAPGGYEFKGWALKGGASVVAKSVFGQNEEWRYYDDGSLDGENWQSTSYKDSAWGTGQAPLGYDNGTSAQGVGGLLNTNWLNQGTTFYFRKEFTLSKAPAEGDTYTLSFTLDDGCVVYVNGTEVGRNNMPSGNVSYDTFASTYAVDNPNTGTMEIPASMFKKGRNVIAVEVHNNSATSSDICWDGALSVASAADALEGEIFTDSHSISLDEVNNGAVLTAVFAPQEPTATLAAASPVCINEVSAANETFANDYYKRNDWIELYNTTDQEIDVAGMYLTDNESKPHKYQIPSQLESGISTIIPAHGYMVIWCDKLTDLTQLHASFKLTADDGCVMLTAADDSWCDYFNYPAHDRNYTAGRYPDGSAGVYLLTKHTPGAANRMSSYAEHYDLQLPVGISAPQAYNDGTLGITFDGERVATSRMARIEVYSTGGELLMAVPSANVLNLGTLGQGIYIARAKADGETAVVKFSKQ